MNPSHQEPDAWLAVLAGQRVATDRATRQAAGLREYVIHQIEEEREHQPDPAQEARLLARLRARGAFAQPEPKPVPEPAATPRHSRFVGVISWLAHWLRPSRGRGASWASGRTGRIGRVGILKDWRTLALLGLAGVVALLLVLKSAGFWPGEGGERPLPQSIDRGIPGIPGIEVEQVIVSANPAQSAAELKALLAQAGVAATVTREGSQIGASLLLQAKLSPAQRQSVNAQLQAPHLQALRLAVPASGKLVVRFKPLL